MMKETNIHSQVTSTIAGDDGEAMAKSEENAKEMAPKKPNEGLKKPDDEEPVTVAPVPLKKGIKVRVVSGSMKGVEAYVQSYNGKKAVIGSEIKYISGATLTISRNLLEIVEN